LEPLSGYTSSIDAFFAMETNTEFSKLHLITTLKVQRLIGIMEDLFSANRKLKRRERLTSLIVSVVNATIEIVALVVELENFGILDKQRESSAHELWRMSD
jgi:hypothetical protein